MPTEPDKGGRTEENLREYFLRAGYYAVRGVPFVIGDVEISDIDVWLYLRPSPLGRERINVDAKDKGRPKAMERVLWAKGVQTVLGFDRAVVATTDRRPIVKAFGDQHGVLVLDGGFLAKLGQSVNGSQLARLSEEEFVTSVVAGKEDRLLGNWKNRFDRSKSRLLTGLEFDGCNFWLEEMRYFADQALVSSRREAACRLIYLLESFVLIGLDYSLRSLAFEPAEGRRRAIEDGFRHGTGGRTGIDRTLQLTASLVERYAPEASSLTAQLRSRLTDDLSKLPVEILGEYFGRVDVSSELFNVARALESKAYGRVFMPPGQLEPALQGAVAVILDFLGIERARFFASFEARGRVD